MKVLASIIVSFFIVWLCSGAKETQTFYVKYVKCNFSSEYYFLNHSCYAKSFNRSCSTATVVFESIRPINYVNGSATSQTIFYFSSELAGAHFKLQLRSYLPPSDNIVTKFLTDMLEESAPGLFHPCPYKKVNVTNAKVKTSTIGSPFATGDYRSIFYFTDDQQGHMFSVLFYAFVSTLRKNIPLDSKLQLIAATRGAECICTQLNY